MSDDIILLIVLLAVILIVSVLIKSSEWLGKHIFKFIQPQIENNIDYFYKTLFLKLSIKGAYNGIIVGQILFAFLIILDFILDIKNIYEDFLSLNIDENISTLQNYLDLNDIIFWLLFIIIGIILVILTVSMFVSMFLFMGGVVGAFWGFIINVLIGLLVNVFIKIDKTKFNFYSLNIDILDFFSTGVIGFLAGVLIINEDLLFSGFIGFLSAIYVKFIHKIKQQIILKLSKKSIPFIFQNLNVIIILSIFIISIYNAFDDNFSFQWKEMVSSLRTTIPFILLFVYQHRIKRNRIISFLSSIRDDFIAEQIHKDNLGKNAILQLFSCSLTFSLTYITTFNIGAGIISIIVTIFIIELKPKVSIFIFYGLMLYIINDTENYIPFLLIWSSLGYLIKYLYNKGNNELSKRKIIEICKWLDEDLIYSGNYFNKKIENKKAGNNVYKK